MLLGHVILEQQLTVMMVLLVPLTFAPLPLDSAPTPLMTSAVTMACSVMVLRHVILSMTARVQPILAQVQLPSVTKPMSSALSARSTQIVMTVTHVMVARRAMLLVFVRLEHQLIVMMVWHALWTVAWMAPAPTHQAMPRVMMASFAMVLKPAMQSMIARLGQLLPALPQMTSVVKTWTRVSPASPTLTVMMACSVTELRHAMHLVFALEE
jgi:hypothetical protein